MMSLPVGKPVQVRPGACPQPRGTGTQPMTVQAICCGGGCAARFFGLPEATFGAAIASAAASAISFLVMPKQVPSGRDRSRLSQTGDISGTGRTTEMRPLRHLVARIPALSFIVPD